MTNTDRFPISSLLRKLHRQAIARMVEIMKCKTMDSQTKNQTVV